MPYNRIESLDFAAEFLAVFWSASREDLNGFVFIELLEFCVWSEVGEYDGFLVMHPPRLINKQSKSRAVHTYTTYTSLKANGKSKDS